MADAKTNDFDAIVVLGGGRPSKPQEPPLFVQNRCDLAAQRYKEQLLRGVGSIILTLSAGTAHLENLRRDDGSLVLESQASAQYLHEKHELPLDAMRMELTSFDTIGNAYFARTQFADVMNWKRILVITTDWHMPRSKEIFEWVFEVDTRPEISLVFEATPSVGLSDEAIVARTEREQKSLKSVKNLRQKFPTLADVNIFLFTQHDLYAVKGLMKKQEKIDDKTMKSYGGTK